MQIFPSTGYEKIATLYVQVISLPFLKHITLSSNIRLKTD